MSSDAPFSLDRDIYQFNGNEPFTIANACEGVQIFDGIALKDSNVGYAAFVIPKKPQTTTKHRD